MSLDFRFSPEHESVRDTVRRLCREELSALVEEAEEMATPERFPDATRIVDSFDVRDWGELLVDGDSYVVIVTRDHAQDQALLEQLIGRELA